MADEQQQPLLDSSNEERQTASYGSSNKRNQDSISDDVHDLILGYLCPQDVYRGEVYWADLEPAERRTWARQQFLSDTRDDLSTVSQIAQGGWFEILRTYVRNYIAPGAGFFAEGNVLFSVGNTMPLLKALWPQCWMVFSVCDKQMINAIKYMEILGIITGQTATGYLGDRLGKRWGLIQDAIIMLLGTLLLAGMWGASLNDWVIMYGISIFVFGYGVGGEYPMTSTSSMEKYHGREDRSHRGRNVLLVFLNQGWGQLTNQLVLMLLLLVSNQSISAPYRKVATQLTFRLGFAVPALALMYIVYFRMTSIGKVKVHERVATLRQIWGHYWHRILATSLCWFCSDFTFYGNQVFRSQLLQLVTGAPPDEVKILWLYNLINIGCELVGYYLAALLIDYKNYGRKKMQLVGFGMMSAIFVFIALCFPQLNQKGVGAKVFQVLFFFSNFWVQFGPNSTTFLVAGEVYPKSLRATIHGLSAAIGKIGALTATVLYNYVEDRTKFVLMSLATLVGFLLTTIFIADTTGLDLEEQQRYWLLVRQGKEDQYHGVAIHTQHLSWYERVILRRNKAYSPDEDRSVKMTEVQDTFGDALQSGNWQMIDAEADNYIDPGVVRFLASKHGVV